MSEAAATSESSSEPATTPANPPPAPLRSVHTGSVAHILNELKCSLMVSTYQCGETGHTSYRMAHQLLTRIFRSFEKADGYRHLERSLLAIGTARQITEFHNVPAVASKLEPVEPARCSLLPRITHHTGDVQIHGRDGLCRRRSHL